MGWPAIVAINVALAVVGVAANFAVRALIAVITTKDYYGKHVRAALDAGFAERRIRVRPGTEINIAEKVAHRAADASVPADDAAAARGNASGPGVGKHGGGTAAHPEDPRIPLLLIPGQGSIWQEYCKVLPHLGDRFRAVAVDVHGHGESSWNPADYTAERIADDITAVLDEVVGGPAIVAGHSSGGIIAALIAARHPGRVRAVLLEDPPFFSTEPDRIGATFTGVDHLAHVGPFLAQDRETDWVCWYMPRSYWKRMFGPLWKVFTRKVVAQRRANPGCVPVIRWVPVGVNRIWESISHPFDLRFSAAFADGSWLRGVDQARTLADIRCPTAFLKATTRHDKEGTLLAALSDEDLARAEELLADNVTTRVRSSHDIHFARTRAYVKALDELADRTA